MGTESNPPATAPATVELPFVPSVVAERDLAQPLVGLGPTADAADRKLFCLVKFGRTPLGVVKAVHPGAGIDADALARLAVGQLGQRITGLLGDPGTDDEKLVDAMLAGRFTELAKPPAPQSDGPDPSPGPGSNTGGVAEPGPMRSSRSSSRPWADQTR